MFLSKYFTTKNWVLKVSAVGLIFQWGILCSLVFLWWNGKTMLSLTTNRSHTSGHAEVL